MGSRGGVDTLVPGACAIHTHREAEKGKGSVTEKEECVWGRYLLVVGVAGLEDTSIVVGGHVLLRWGRSERPQSNRETTDPVASHDVVDVVAVLRGIGSDAGAETELIIRDKAGPFVVLLAGSEGVSVYEASD